MRDTKTYRSYKQAQAAYDRMEHPDYWDDDIDVEPEEETEDQSTKGEEEQ